jgi:acyl carrier protein|tara:strand:+ start:539 stop:772 length:234 start_codon:yes stop_codon:yes gene_type:complete
MELKEKVISIIKDQMSNPNLDVEDDMLFIDDLGFDSLDTVQLVMDLEEEFDISIPDEDAEELLQVGQAIEYIKEQVD